MRKVQLKDVKANLSAVVDQAIRGKPSLITRHGKPEAVVLGLDGRMPIQIDAGSKRGSGAGVRSDLPDARTPHGRQAFRAAGRRLSQCRTRNGRPRRNAFHVATSAPRSGGRVCARSGSERPSRGDCHIQSTGFRRDARPFGIEVMSPAQLLRRVMKNRQSTYPLRLPRSVKAEAPRQGRWHQRQSVRGNRSYRKAGGHEHGNILRRAPRARGFFRV
ncbi:MAG: type II toxin-antitoxin system prevent-host-death family antitoxin [Hyphomicrobiales bacterium]|nr:type II toxin-antitoxin system prevent-host-death family antitoxin [Hyphomicrobiales bacterium]